PGARGREARVRRRVRKRGRARGHRRVPRQTLRALQRAMSASVRTRDETGRTTDELAELVRGARSVVALTGAGISTPSGIPDFRSPGTGLWETVDPMQVAHIDAFHADPARFWKFYSARFAALESKQPNAAHHALAE